MFCYQSQNHHSRILSGHIAVAKGNLILFFQVLDRTELDEDTLLMHTGSWYWMIKMKQKETTKQKRLGFGAGLLMGMFCKNPKPHSSAELYKKDFHPNTQKMGLRFTNRMRNLWRPKWLRFK